MESKPKNFVIKQRKVRPRISRLLSTIGSLGLIPFALIGLAGFSFISLAEHIVFEQKITLAQPFAAIMAAYHRLTNLLGASVEEPVRSLVGGLPEWMRFKGNFNPMWRDVFVLYAACISALLRPLLGIIENKYNLIKFLLKIFGPLVALPPALIFGFFPIPHDLNSAGMATCGPIIIYYTVVSLIFLIFFAVPKSKDAEEFKAEDFLKSLASIPVSILMLMVIFSGMGKLIFLVTESENTPLIAHLSLIFIGSTLAIFFGLLRAEVANGDKLDRGVLMASFGIYGSLISALIIVFSSYILVQLKPAL